MDVRAKDTNCQNVLFPKLSNAQKLCCDVDEAEWERAQKKVELDPTLITQQISHKIAEEMDEITTPVKYACKLKDTRMWLMFLKVILGFNDSKPLHLMVTLPEDLTKYQKSYILAYPKLYFIDETNEPLVRQIKYPELLKSFLQQAYEQREHVNLDSIFAAYQNYKTQLAPWRRNEITDQEIALAWFNVGKKQRELPKHLLRDFCRRFASPYHNLWVLSEFDVNIDAPSLFGIRAYNHHIHKYEAVTPFLPNVGLGYDFAMVRGRKVLPLDDDGAQKLSGIGGCEDAEQDAENFRKLYDKRTSDLAQLHSQWELVLKLESAKKTSPTPF